MWLDKVVPSLEKIDCSRVDFPIFAEVHGFAYEPCKMIPECEVNSLGIGCMDMSF